MHKRIMFITSGLSSGGAEKMLFQIASQLSNRGNAIEVISLKSGGYYKKRLTENSIKVHELDVGPMLCRHGCIMPTLLEVSRQNYTDRYLLYGALGIPPYLSKVLP